MFRRTIPALFLLASCGGAAGGDVSITVSGVEMKDLEAVKTELAKLQGVSDLRVDSVKDGQAVLSVRYTGSGGALAAEMLKTQALKQVKAFDDKSVRLSWTAEVAAAPTPAPAPAPEPVPVPPTPDPTPAPETAPPPAPTAESIPQVSERTFKGGRTSLPADWLLEETGYEEGISYVRIAPPGTAADFVIAVGVAGEGVSEDIFEDGPEYMAVEFPSARRIADPKRAKLGGDEALIETYAAEGTKGRLLIRAIYLKRANGSAMILGVGLEARVKAMEALIDAIAAATHPR